MPGEPVCSVIVFCDLVITEYGSGKNSLIGSFPNLGNPQFPFSVPRFFVHVSIANIVPTDKPVYAVINLKQVASGAVVGSASVTVPILKNLPKSAPGMHINLNVPFQNVTFPAPGDYECEVLFDGERIGDRILDVEQVALPQTNPPPNPLNP